MNLNNTCLCFNCNNKTTGLKGARKNICMDCLRSSQPYIFKCSVCDNTFSALGLTAKLPKYCSMLCKNKGKYINHGRAWYFKNKLKQ